jgi:hypothetical protein
MNRKHDKYKPNVNIIEEEDNNEDNVIRKSKTKKNKSNKRLKEFNSEQNKKEKAIKQKIIDEIK